MHLIVFEQAANFEFFNGLINRAFGVFLNKSSFHPLGERIFRPCGPGSDAADAPHEAAHGFRAKEWERMKASSPRVIGTALALAMVFLVCSTATATDSARFDWKMATVAPDGVGWARHIKSMVLPVIEEATEGELNIKIYWGAIMGDDEDIIEKTRKGILQGGGLTGQGVTMVVPAMNVLELPFMFRSYDEVDYVKERMTPAFDRLFAEQGFFLAAWIDQDFDQIYSVEHELDTVESFSRATFLTWYGKVEEMLLEKLGAQAVPVNVPDAAVSVKTGRTDSAIAPALYVVGTQMYCVARYVNPVKIRYSPAVIVVRDDAWRELDEAYRKRYHERRGPLMRRFCEAVRKDNEKALESMYQYGLKRTDMPPAEAAGLKRKVRPIWDELAGDLYTRELLDELLGHLEEFRNGQTQ